MNAKNSQHSTATDLAMLCPACAYDLRGLPAGTCPECGHAFDPAELSRSQIPWSYRKVIGLFRAYWRTVWLVMFRDRQFRHEISRPVSYRDARWFQTLTVILTVVSLIAVVVAIHLADEIEAVTLLLDKVWTIPIAVGLLALFVTAITGVHTYWFHPRRLPIVHQNRSVALSYYCCAPLAWTPILAALTIAITADVAMQSPRQTDPPWVAMILSVPLFLGTLGVVVSLWFLPVRMVHFFATRGLAAQATLAVVLPVLWALLGAIILVGIPATIGWLWIVYASLQL